MNTNNRQEEENITKSLQSLITLITLFPKFKELKSLGLDVKISKKDSFYSLELGLLDKCLEEVIQDKTDTYEFMGHQKNKDNGFGEKINATLISAIKLTQYCTDKYDDILENMFDWSLEAIGDEHIRYSIKWLLEENKKDKSMEDPIVKETLKAKIYDELIAYFNKLLIMPCIDSKYCYDRDFIKKVVLEWASLTGNFKEPRENNEKFQKDFNDIVNITKFIETISGLFGKYLRIFKFFDFDCFDIKFYSRNKKASIFLNIFASGLNVFLQEKIISLFK